MQCFARARISGLTCDATSGFINTAFGYAPVCRFTVVSSCFRISGDTLQLPPPTFNAENFSGNAHVVHVVGPQLFVDELTAFFQTAMVVELCGHYHTEKYPTQSVPHHCPSVMLSLTRLKNTEDALRVLYASHEDATTLRSRLRGLISQHAPHANETR